MRLNVNIFGFEKLLAPFARQVFDNISELAATVVTLAGIALRVFIGEDARRRFENGFRCEVLAGNQFEPGVLPIDFVLDLRENFWVYFGETPRHSLLFVHGIDL